MANANENLILKNVRGQIGKQFIVKQYRGKTILTAYPNMPQINLQHFNYCIGNVLLMQ